MDKKVVVTASGLKALEDELEMLKTVRRSEISEKIRVARGYGDLSENSEYDEAKNEQAIVEARIADLDLGKISDESPVGKALMGKKVGDVAEAILPTGDTAKFRVISIG